MPMDFDPEKHPRGEGGKFSSSGAAANAAETISSVDEKKERDTLLALRMAKISALFEKALLDGGFTYDVVVAQCAQVQDALRRVLPMSEAWFRREFDGLCDHEPGECHCDRGAHARTDINIALAALGKVAP